MLNAAEPIIDFALPPGIQADVLAACGQIPPLWDLQNYVAVNPFLGFASQPFDEAAKVVGDGLGARVLPGFDFYRAQWAQHAFGEKELEAASLRSGQEIGLLRAILNSEAAEPAADRSAQLVLTFTERYDLAHGTQWNEKMLRWVARWCAVHVAEDGSQWGGDERQSLFASWREAAGIDRSLEVMGLRGWRKWAQTLPNTSAEAIAYALTKLDVPETERVAYFYRLLGGLYGWASYLRRTSWQGGSAEAGELGDLLAIRLCCDAGIVALASTTQALPKGAARHVEDESVQLALQEALEDGFASTLISSLNPPPQEASTLRPAVQAVFCIDVRSELVRRHLEAQSQSVQTRGFAGFFGVSLDWRVDGEGSARCPVLLSPSVSLRPHTPAPQAMLGQTAEYVKTAPAGAFAFVEILGLGYGLKMGVDALAARSAAQNDEEAARFDLSPNAGGGIELNARADIAAGILKNMGFTDQFARIVLLCGHAGCSANNPHAAGLDCGACGGHGGAINARVAAAILNDSGVRSLLSERQVMVPSDTIFIPALHDTSTDEVTLLDVDRIPTTHAPDATALRHWLAEASAGARKERAPALGFGDLPAEALKQSLQRRARDWSEVRPEWALARNASFITARRERTRGVNLQGRAFLHEYDAAVDPDGSILTLILSAPMVVASWINLQYFASTVDNDFFGAGDKALHNRIGDIGVVLGNGGDLRTGLAKQSVHAADGRWYHQPLRLQVIVEAPRERIETVLAAQKSVRDLVDNGWVRLFALDPAGSSVSRWIPKQGWEIATTSESASGALQHA